MSKYVNVTVSASLSTDFYIEVPDNATDAEIKELAEREVILPNDYPQVTDATLQRLGVRVCRLDSMLRAWNIDELEFIIDGGDTSN